MICIWYIHVFYSGSWLLEVDDWVLGCLPGLCSLQVRCLSTSPWRVPGRPCCEAYWLGNNWWRCWLLGGSLSKFFHVVGVGWSHGSDFAACFTLIVQCASASLHFGLLCGDFLTQLICLSCNCADCCKFLESILGWGNTFTPWSCPEVQNLQSMYQGDSSLIVIH